MKYKGKEIGIPTREMIEEYSKLMNVRWNIDDFIAYWNLRQWHLSSLEFAVNHFQRIVLRPFSMKNNKLAKKQRVPPTQEQIDRRSKYLSQAPILENDISLKPIKKDPPPVVWSPKIKHKSKSKDNLQKRRKRKVQKVILEHFDYAELLQDPKWKAYRQEVFKTRGKLCEKCGRKDNLQIHHIKYVFGWMPWDYPISSVRVLCGECHQKLHDKQSKSN